MHTHRNTRCLKFLYKGAFLFAVFRSINKLNLTWFVNVHLCILVNISICMTRKCDRFLPVFHTRFNSFYNDWSAEHCSIKDRTDCSVRALPHFFQIVFRHAGCVWSDRCTFDCNSIFLCSFCRIKCYLIVCLVSVF